MVMSATETWVAGEHVFSSPLGEDMALLDTRTNRYFTLNPTAATVWESLSGPESRDGIAAALARKFDIAAEDCLDDVDEILRDLAAQDLIRPAGDGTAG